MRLKVTLLQRKIFNIVIKSYKGWLQIDFKLNVLITARSGVFKLRYCNAKLVTLWLRRVAVGYKLTLI